MNADPRGYYAALHLTPAATQADIQRAFRALIRVHHPDVGPSGPGGEGGGADVRSILAAFTVLRNPLTRAEYDRNGRVPDVREATGAKAQGAKAGGATAAAAGRTEAAPADGSTPGGARAADGATTGAGRPADGATPAGPRDIPVRHHRGRGPALRVGPVRWERGPWERRS